MTTEEILLQTVSSLTKTNEEQGRQIAEPFHIDHRFAAPEIVKKMTIQARWQWLALSDHLPIEIELNNLFEK
ncbi:MAG: hypothetical protein K2L17_04385 [Muribaculaceae bacterium]|nr:hypothetical protein [Muribaculaceae bacterium]